LPEQNFDVIIIGGGMAGLTAGIYAARHGLNTAIVEQMMAGAQIINLERIENYPGFPQGIAGYELGPATQEQAMNAGVAMLMDTALNVTSDGDYLRVVGDGGDSYLGKAVIMAAGSSLRTLGIPGEEEFFGRGVSHCATCDGPLYMGQTVAVVGGGDSAADEALTLTEYTERVILFHRGDSLDAQQVLQDRVAAEPKIEVRSNAEVVEVVGEETVTGLRVRHGDDETVEPVGGLFVYVGLDPNSASVADLVPLDNAGHVPVGLSMDTPQPGLYAAGDIRQQSAAQLVASAGDGATAAIAAFRYIRGKEW
jgi:thioredoxin reductase (NADPH)